MRIYLTFIAYTLLHYPPVNPQHCSVAATHTVITKQLASKANEKTVKYETVLVLNLLEKYEPFNHMLVYGHSNKKLKAD